MFWSKKDLTTLEVIDRELTRLHDELNQIVWDTSQKEVDPAYALLLNQIDKLNQQLVDLAKGKNE